MCEAWAAARGYPLSTWTKIRYKIKQMRNTYQVYKLCKYIYDNSKIHRCDDSFKVLDNGCEILGLNSISSFNRLLKLSHELKNNKRNKYYQYFTFQNYAEDKNYIESYKCKNDSEIYLKLTTKGLELTDNIFLPFTPIGLWKAIHEEHKVFGRLVITAITSIVLSASGITLAYAISIARRILGV